LHKHVSGFQHFSFLVESSFFEPCPFMRSQFLAFYARSVSHLFMNSGLVREAECVVCVLYLQFEIFTETRKILRKAEILVAFYSMINLCFIALSSSLFSIIFLFPLSSILSFFLSPLFFNFFLQFMFSLLIVSSISIFFFFSILLFFQFLFLFFSHHLSCFL